MKTLIFCGSPRKSGETAALIQAVKAELAGEIIEIYPDGKIHSCTDCRYCRKNAGCAIQDGWKDLRQTIQEADGILIASPVWFGTLTGELLSMLSRLQSDFSARFFRQVPQEKNKKGAILLTAGGTGDVGGAIQTATILLREMGAGEIFPPVCSLQTDRLPAARDEAALAGAKEIARFLKDETKRNQ